MKNLPKKSLHKQTGFTLIEIMLVLVIISIMLYGSITYIQQRAQTARINRTATQMQQILNAGLAFYVANGTWPTSVAQLQVGYLPAGTIRNPWGQNYFVTSSSAGASGTFATAPPLFYVWTTVTSGTPGGAAAAANAILGNVPLGYTTSSGGTPPTNPASGGSACSTGASCKVVATVNIPGQNLNNARAVNFAGLYHHGGCVPVPQCPVDLNGQTMTPEVIIIPVSLSGINDDNNNTNVYPISSFTAYASGAPAATPPGCLTSSPTSCAPLWTTSSSTYWRACVQIITEEGEVASTRPSDDKWGVGVTLAAFTRCAVNNEPAGSNFTVYTH